MVVASTFSKITGLVREPTIRSKLMFIISVLVISSLGIISISNLRSFQREMTNMVTLLNTRTTKLLANKLDDEIGRRIENLKLLSGLHQAYGQPARLGQAFLKNHTLFIGIFNRNILHSQAGLQQYRLQLYNDSLLKALGLSRNGIQQAMLQHRIKIQKALLGETLVVNSSPTLKQPSLMLLVPLDSNEAMIAVYSSDQLAHEFLGGHKAQKQQASLFTSYLVDNNGSIVIHPDPGLVKSAASMANIEIVKTMFSSKAIHGWQSYSDQGQTMFGAYQRMQLSNLGVVTTVAKDTALEAVRKSRDISVTATLLILAIAIVFIYYFARSLSEPIKRLVYATEKVSEGDYSTRLSPKTKDEVGHLTRAFNNMTEGLKDREKLKGAFGKFVNEEIAQKVLNDEIHLGGEQKKATIFFSDIRNFTTISEPLRPAEVVEFLNEYMSLMVNCIHDTGGVVDKYIGDAIMAIYSEPFSKGNHSLHCVEAALKMRAALLKFNKNRGTKKKPIIQIGCGINSGPVLAGQIGSEDRLEYTVIGDSVNLASRLESLNKQFGTDILISGSTFEKVKTRFKCERLKKVKVKGKKEAQEVYAVLGRISDKDCPASLNELRELLGITTRRVGGKTTYIYEFLKKR